MSTFFPLSLSPLYFEAISHRTQSLWLHLGWLSSSHLSTSLSPGAVSYICRCMLPYQTFEFHWGSELRFLCMSSRNFIYRANFPIPQLMFARRICVPNAYFRGTVGHRIKLSLIFSFLSLPDLFHWVSRLFHWYILLVKFCTFTNNLFL